MSQTLATLDDAADRLTAELLAGRQTHAAYERGSAYLARLADRLRAEEQGPAGLPLID